MWPRKWMSYSNKCWEEYLITIKNIEHNVSKMAVCSCHHATLRSIDNDTPVCLNEQTTATSICIRSIRSAPTPRLGNISSARIANCGKSVRSNLGLQIKSKPTTIPKELIWRYRNNSSYIKMSDNTTIVLAERPSGNITLGKTFAVKSGPRPTAADLKDEEVLAETIYLSLDPAMRGWLDSTLFKFESSSQNHTDHVIL